MLAYLTMSTLLYLPFFVDLVHRITGSSRTNEELDVEGGDGLEEPDVASPSGADNGDNGDEEDEEDDVERLNLSNAQSPDPLPNRTAPERSQSQTQVTFASSLGRFRKSRARTNTLFSMSSSLQDRDDYDAQSPAPQGQYPNGVRIGRTFTSNSSYSVDVESGRPSFHKSKFYLWLKRKIKYILQTGDDPEHVHKDFIPNYRW